MIRIGWFGELEYTIMAEDNMNKHSDPKIDPKPQTLLPKPKP